jgi:acyl dehydratase
MMPTDSKKPIYEWAVAKVGDRRRPESIPVSRSKVALYAKSSGDTNPLFTDEAFAKAHGFEAVAVPIAMTTRVAPHKRREIIAQNGYEAPVRPTPFARWQCKLFAPMKPGDVITSEAVVGEKFEKRGRRYITWSVIARNQNGETVAEYSATNSWEGSKPEDKTR